MTKKNIWTDYNNASRMQNDFLNQHQNEFSADLRNEGAGEDEINDILNLMWNSDTYYMSANEALADYRKYHKITFDRLLQIFNSPDFYDDEIVINEEAAKTLREWRDNPCKDFLHGLPENVLDLLNDYYQNEWYHFKNSQI